MPLPDILKVVGSNLAGSINLHSTTQSIKLIALEEEGRNAESIIYHQLIPIKCCALDLIKYKAVVFPPLIT